MVTKHRYLRKIFFPHSHVHSRLYSFQHRRDFKRQRKFNQLIIDLNSDRVSVIIFAIESIRSIGLLSLWACRVNCVF